MIGFSRSRQNRRAIYEVPRRCQCLERGDSTEAVTGGRAVDAGTAGLWADLLARLKRKGQAMPVKHSLIAASAIQHQLSIVTRNVADFRHAGVPLIDPFVG